jgi:oxygen-independent coproporphyrinogen-3 oxidase
VQSLSPEVLRIVNRRYQTLETVAAAVRALRRVGINTINCDLIMGLPGDTGASFLAGLETLMRLEPSTIMITKYQPMDYMLRKYFKGRYEDFVISFDERYAAIIPRMLRLGVRAGYTVDNPYANELGWRFISDGYEPNYDAAKPYYCSAGNYPASLLGLGHFSRSRIFGRFDYEMASAPAVFDSDEAMFFGKKASLRQEMSRYIINRISCVRAISKSRFQTIFGVPLMEEYAEVIDGLKRLGQVKVEGDAVRFLPRDTKELFICSRLFLEIRTTIVQLARQYRGIVAGGSAEAKGANVP